MSNTAIVTGGTRGIGAAVSVALSEDGHKIAATYAGNDQAGEAFMTQTGISLYRFDVADFDQCADSVSRIETDLGAVGILGQQRRHHPRRHFAADGLLAVERGFAEQPLLLLQHVP